MLLARWRRFADDRSTGVLAEDVDTLCDVGQAPAMDWPSFAGRPDFGARDHRLHLSLVPQPFVGSLATARVILLFLNPGLSPSDYYAEHNVPEYRDALLATLRQRGLPEQHPHMFLDPRFSWHSGFAWWHKKVRPLVAELAREKGVSLADALSVFSRSVAAIQLVPYHSATFRGGTWVKKLPSSQLAREFVAEQLAPRAKRGEIGIVVTRGAEHWRIRGADNVAVYSAQQARGAHLGLESPGGLLVLKHLRAAWAAHRK